MGLNTSYKVNLRKTESQVKVYIITSICTKLSRSFESGLVSKRANEKFHATRAVAFAWED